MRETEELAMNRLLSAGLRPLNSLLVVLALTGFGFSQESQQGDEPESTLPPVIVEPEDQPEQVPSGDSEGDFDNDQNNDDPFDPFDLPESYPSLSQQTFGDLSSGLRAQRSIFDDPRHVTIIGPQDLTERAPMDMGEAIQRTSGVMVQRTGRGQSSPFIRGLTGQQIVILVDGVRMPSATFRAGPNQYFNSVDPGSVERIEIIRGPQSVLYGSDAIGGVINIVTKGPVEDCYDYATGGTIQRFSTADLGYYGRMSVEGWVGASGAYAGANYGNYNNVDRGGDLGRQPATSFAQYGGDIKFKHWVDDWTELTVGLQHFEMEDVFRSDRFPANRETIFDPQQRDLGFVRLQGYDLNGWIESYSITGSYHQTVEGRLDRNPIASPIQDQRKFRDEQVGVNLLFSTDLEMWGRITYGFDWYHEDVDASRRRVDSSVSPPVVTPSSETQFPDDAWYSRYGAFLEWDVQIAPRLSAVSGVRYSHIATGATVTAGSATGPIDPEYQAWTGSGGLTYEINPCWNLVGSVAQGFRAPNLDDLTADNNNVFMGSQIPNPDLRPERSITYEVGTKFDTSRLHAQAFVFWTDIKDNMLRRQTNDPGFVLRRENRDSKLQGVEFDGEALLNCGWSVYGNFTYLFGQDIEGDEPLSRIPPVQGTVGLRWRDACGNSWFDIYGWLVDEQDRLSARDISDPRIPDGGTPAFATLNARAGRRITEHQRISFNLDNITDAPYRVHGSGADGPGISLIMSYEWLH